jgi:hypothetical protein
VYDFSPLIEFNALPPSLEIIQGLTLQGRSSFGLQAIFVLMLWRAPAYG